VVELVERLIGLSGMRKWGGSCEKARGPLTGVRVEMTGFDEARTRSRVELSGWNLDRIRSCLQQRNGGGFRDEQ
jgi:hypothetical protein